MHYTAVTFFLLFLGIFPLLPCSEPQAAASPLQCRGAGMPADAPLYYLELMTYDDAEKARQLLAKAFEAHRATQSNQAWEVTAAAATAKISRVGTPTSRIGVEEAKKRWEELEIIAVLAVAPQQMQAFFQKQAALPRQQQLDTEYRGETRNIVPTDLNHDGIADFIFQEDPHLDLIVHQLFLGCGDNFYTPLGFFSAGRSREAGPAVTTRRRNIAGIRWDIFEVIAPDLPVGKMPHGDADIPQPRWAERVITFDPDKGIYREISAKPLPPDYKKPR